MQQFEYQGFHFTPVAQLHTAMSLFELSPFLRSDPELGMAAYSLPWVKRSWDYDAFYHTCGEKLMDLFLCEETGRIYIPGRNELFEWTGEVPAETLLLKRKGN